MTKKNLVLLTAIVAAMANAAAPYHMVSAADAKGLLKDGMVEQNADIADGDKLATRATDKGTKFLNDHNASIAALPTSATAVQGAPGGLFKGAVFSAGRASTSSDAIPFDQFEVGDNMFIPNTSDRPDAAKSLASTVSSATKRYATEVEGQTRTNRRGNVVAVTQNTRVFAVKAVKAGVAYGEWTAPADGAVIVRTA